MRTHLAMLVAWLLPVSVSAGPGFDIVPGSQIPASPSPNQKTSNTKDNNEFECINTLIKRRAHAEATVDTFLRFYHKTPCHTLKMMRAYDNYFTDN